ncbi:LysE family translocator [Aurantimonas endophytica]|uniref:Threonine/homoserine/homoserine lactone efflux protein n=1 Tax=Aurantimonas endophytica TaxID=1522175 RepID=A0A7W6HFL9_9HYPH|nr:LysE family translocator [Aurantimonas endophytica]MBB4004256.1 threonine/homoserine/homoserine lactone efflux protein [Aurantimonas endophytica]MCO6405096.1 LysE family transporter [Aurantimonas endophytica]
MGTSNLLAFALATFFLVSSPGPNGALIARTVPTSGVPAAFANVAGFFTAFWVHGTLSVLGLSVIIMQSATAFAIVKYVGAAYLCWIGLKSLYESFVQKRTRPDAPLARRARSLRGAYLDGLLTNGLNPKVSMFYLAVFPQFIPVGDHPVASAYTLVAIHSLINVAWFTLVILLFARLATFTRSGGFQRCIKGATGVVFLGFGYNLARFRPVG